MGSLNYYIKIAGDSQALAQIAAEYTHNKTYQETFGLMMCEEGNGEFTLGIEALIDNFLPTNHMLFSLFSRYAIYDLYIVDDQGKQKIGAMSKTDFIQYMYCKWENRIDLVYAQFGTMVIKYKRYHRNRKKLYPKYYVKIR